jgi:hypothetical protein
MKYPVTYFKNLAVALKELEPYIINGNLIVSGRPLKRLNNMLPREALANWLLCAVTNYDHNVERFLFTSDPIGGDGIIIDILTSETWPTEHTMVPAPFTEEEKKKSIDLRILEAIQAKVAKGSEYAEGMQLVVLINSGGGYWTPNKIAKKIPRPLHFFDVWALGLVDPNAKGYIYVISQLSCAENDVPTWMVQINDEFNNWSVKRIQ